MSQTHSKGNFVSIESAASGHIQHLHRLCPLCERDNRDEPRSSFSRDVWSIKDCAACGFVYLENAVPYDELVQNFAWTKTARTERKARQKREPLFFFFSSRWKNLQRKWNRRNKAVAAVHRHVGEGNVLDVGCSIGPNFRRFHDAIVPFGIEIDLQAAIAADSLAAQRGGRVLHCDGVSGMSQFEAEFFDGILMETYLEHENEPQEILRRAAVALCPGGKLIIKVPNFASWNRHVRGTRWCGFRYPDHVNYFTPGSLAAIVEHAGLEVTHFNFFAKIPTSDNMWMVAQRPVRQHPQPSREQPRRVA